MMVTKSPKMRYANELSREKGKLVQYTTVFDLEELSKSQLAWLPYFKVVVSWTILASPEMLNFACVINTPWFFNMVWGIVKPWVDEKTLTKVHFLASEVVRII